MFEKTSQSAKQELALAKTMLRLTGASWLYVGGMEYEGRLISIAMAERCGETLHVHIEKALYGYEGVYPATVQEFARCFAVDGVRYLNREDDAGDRGLRTSKLQYLPCKLAEKFCFDVKNELEDLDAIPTLKTERLTLSAFTDKDREAYNALCLDDERNKWWGYDYRADWKGEDLNTYFLDVVREDFAKKRAINFAIRLDGKCIGEVLLVVVNIAVGKIHQHDHGKHPLQDALGHILNVDVQFGAQTGHLCDNAHGIVSNDGNESFHGFHPRFPYSDWCRQRPGTRLPFQYSRFSKF